MSEQVKRRGLLEPTVFTVVGIAFLIGLGIWQLDRKTWKENLIATVTTRINRAPQDLPPRASWPDWKSRNAMRGSPLSSVSLKLWGI